MNPQSAGIKFPSPDGDDTISPALLLLSEREVFVAQNADAAHRRRRHQFFFFCVLMNAQDIME